MIVKSGTLFNMPENIRHHRRDQPPRVTLEQVDEALAELSAANKIITCGAVHERTDVSFGVDDCPYRTTGNLACCHGYVNGSAAFIVAKCCRLLRTAQAEIGESLFTHGEMQNFLATVNDAAHLLGNLDDQLAKRHQYESATTIRRQNASTQNRAGARINDVRLQVIAGLELLREVLRQKISIT